MNTDTTTCELCGNTKPYELYETIYGDACMTCKDNIDRTRRGYNPTTGWTQQ